MIKTAPSLLSLNLKYPKVMIPNPAKQNNNSAISAGPTPCTAISRNTISVATTTMITLTRYTVLFARIKCSLLIICTSIYNLSYVSHIPQCANSLFNYNTNLGNCIYKMAPGKTKDYYVCWLIPMLRFYTSLQNRKYVPQYLQER